MHKCDKNDFKNFYPPSKTINKTISELKEKKTFWCINSVDTEGNPLKSKMFGREEMDSFRIYDFKFSTCIPEQLNSSNSHQQKEKCLADYNN